MRCAQEYQKGSSAECAHWGEWVEPHVEARWVGPRPEGISADPHMQYHVAGTAVTASSEPGESFHPGIASRLCCLLFPRPDSVHSWRGSICSEAVTATGTDASAPGYASWTLWGYCSHCRHSFRAAACHHCTDGDLATAGGSLGYGTVTDALEGASQTDTREIMNISNHSTTPFGPVGDPNFQRVSCCTTSFACITNV